MPGLIAIALGNTPPGCFVFQSLGCMQGGKTAFPASRSSGEVQSAYSALLEAALSQLQLLGADAGSTKQSKKAHRAAQDRLYGLLEALAQVSPAWSHCCMYPTSLSQPLLPSSIVICIAKVPWVPFL